MLKESCSSRNIKCSTNLFQCYHPAELSTSSCLWTMNFTSLNEGGQSIYCTRYRIIKSVHVKQGRNVCTQLVAEMIIVFIVVNIYFSFLERLSLHGHTHTQNHLLVSVTLYRLKCVLWQKKTPDKKQGKHGFLGNWHVTTHCSLNYSGFKCLRYKVRGEDLQISTVTFSSQSQSFQAYDHLLSPSPRPVAPIGASGSPGRMPLFGWEVGIPSRL